MTSNQSPQQQQQQRFGTLQVRIIECQNLGGESTTDNVVHENHHPNEEKDPSATPLPVIPNTPSYNPYVVLQLGSVEYRTIAKENTTHPIFDATTSFDNVPCCVAVENQKTNENGVGDDATTMYLSSSAMTTTTTTSNSAITNRQNGNNDNNRELRVAVMDADNSNGDDTDDCLGRTRISLGDLEQGRRYIVTRHLRLISSNDNNASNNEEGGGSEKENFNIKYQDAILRGMSSAAYDSTETGGVIVLEITAIDFSGKKPTPVSLLVEKEKEAPNGENSSSSTDDVAATTTSATTTTKTAAVPLSQLKTNHLSVWAVMRLQMWFRKTKAKLEMKRHALERRIAQDLECEEEEKEFFYSDRAIAAQRMQRLGRGLITRKELRYWALSHPAERASTFEQCLATISRTGFHNPKRATVTQSTQVSEMIMARDRGQIALLKPIVLVSDYAQTNPEARKKLDPLGLMLKAIAAKKNDKQQLPPVTPQIGGLPSSSNKAAEDVDWSGSPLRGGAVAGAGPKNKGPTVAEVEAQRIADAEAKRASALLTANTFFAEGKDWYGGGKQGISNLIQRDPVSALLKKKRMKEKGDKLQASASFRYRKAKTPTMSLTSNQKNCDNANNATATTTNGNNNLPSLFTPQSMGHSSHLSHFAQDDNDVDDYSPSRAAVILYREKQRKLMTRQQRQQQEKVLNDDDDEYGDDDGTFTPPPLEKQRQQQGQYSSSPVSPLSPSKVLQAKDVVSSDTTDIHLLYAFGPRGLKHLKLTQLEELDSAVHRRFQLAKTRQQWH